MSWEATKHTAIPYLNFCREAISDDALFSTFKVNSKYTPILSHVNINEGLQYLREADSDTLEHCKQNDMHGGAPLYNYGTIEADPTSLRYARFVTHIRNYLGDNLGNVLEIGGGYGGLCLFVSKTLQPDSYSIIDDEAVLPFIDKYLSIHNIQRETGEKEYDTVLSTYAWDELDAPTREKHFKVIESSSRGYIIGKDSILDQHTWGERYTRIADTVTQNYSIIYWNETQA